ncbi:membrane associated protein, partial [Trypanosoma rangeli]
MDSADSIENILMMEMEREVERNKASRPDPYGNRSALPPPFEITPIDDRLAQKDEKAIKAEIERRLRAKQQEQTNRENLAYSSFPLNSSPALETAAIHASKQSDSKTDSEERALREAEERALREAEERALREAEERALREAEERARKEAEERALREAEERARKEAEERARKEAEER